LKSYGERKLVYHPLVSKIGIVIPTAFNRPQYLPIAYQSIITQLTDFEIELIIGCPSDKIEAVRASLPAGTRVIAESREAGLAKKLDALLKETSPDCEFLAWLGDDDILLPGSLAAATQALGKSISASMAFGGCDYIDAEGRILFTNSNGVWAAQILSFGPQLIPQPGSVMRRDAYIATGGLSNEFALAFDFDLFLKLKKQGPFVFVDQTLAQFRWHQTSLSVKRRMTSALEASRVRRKHYRGLARIAWLLWEPVVILATWAAGKLVSLRTR
jgi:glycosyltransferase involved in cell wall biosynthesis